MPVFKYRDPQTGGWINVAGGGGGAANIPIQDEPPASVDLWVDTSEEGASGGSVDAYTKEETLSEETKVALGLGADAVPDEAFNLLSKVSSSVAGIGNEYVWGKIDYVGTYSSVTNVEGANYATMLFINNTSTTELYVSDSFDEVAAGKAPKIAVSATEAASELNGRYVRCITATSEHILTDSVYFVPASATWTKWKGTYGYAADSLTRYDGVSFKIIYPEYVNSPNANAYGDGYDYLGRLGDAFGGAKIATGSYTGTDTYGASNPNSLTFDFVPRVVFLVASWPISGSTYHAIGLLLCFAGYGWLESTGTDEKTKATAATRAGVKVTVSDNTVYWYNTQGVQFNTNGMTVEYLAIG